MPNYIIKLTLKGTKLDVESCFLPTRRVCAADSCKKNFTAESEVYQIFCNDCLITVVKCEHCGLEDVSSMLLEAIDKDKKLKKICSLCASRHYVKCGDCKKWFHPSLVKHLSGAAVCKACAKSWKLCNNCQAWGKERDFSSYKDEFVDYASVCARCKKEAATDVPQNVPISEDINSIETRIRKKKNPVLKLAGSFLYKQGDYNLKQIVELLEKAKFRPLKDIYFYGLKTEDFTVCSNEAFSKPQKNFAEENNIGLRVSEAATKDRLSIGLSTDLRESAPKCAKFIAIFLGDDMRRVVKTK